MELADRLVRGRDVPRHRFHSEGPRREGRAGYRAFIITGAIVESCRSPVASHGL